MYNMYYIVYDGNYKRENKKKMMKLIFDPIYILLWVKS